MHPGYFEGTVQLRNVSSKVISFARRFVEKHDAYIAKEVHHKNGVDLLVSSQKVMQKLGKELQFVFGGQLTITRKLFSKNKVTSKNIYRLTVLFRQRSVKKGQVITVKGEKFKVVLVGNKVGAKNVETGKSVSFRYDQLP